MFERNHDRCIRNFNTFLDANRDCNETLGVLILLKRRRAGTQRRRLITNNKKKKENLKIHRIITKQNQGGSGYVYITHFSLRDFCFLFFFFSILIKNCTRFCRNWRSRITYRSCRIFIMCVVCFQSSSLLTYYIVIFYYRNKKKKKEIGFVKEYLVTLESLRKLLKKRYVIREWSAYDGCK